MEAVEITSFRLKGYSCKEFIDANKDIDEWLKQQPGFRSRRIFEQGNCVLDMLIWDTVQNGTYAMHRLLNKFSDSIIHQMIDQSTVSWNMDEVRHRVENHAY